MADERFTAGTLVEVSFIEGGQRITYQATVIGDADRKGDYVVQVVSVGPGSDATVGARLAPMLGLKVEMNEVARSQETRAAEAKTMTVQPAPPRAPPP